MILEQFALILEHAEVLLEDQKYIRTTENILEVFKVY